MSYMIVDYSVFIGVHSFGYFILIYFDIFLWFSKDARAAFILSPLACLIALAAANMKERVRTLSFRIISGVFVFLLSSLVWVVLLIPDISDILGVLYGIFSGFTGMSGGDLMVGMSMVKYLITVLTALLTLGIFDRFVKAPEEEGTTKLRTVLDSAVNLLMLATFAFSVFFYYPQFPAALSA